ncbi:phenazine antibiotic biosynthesis protein [Saccharopolyspora indica]|uniref:phenazine antibiotic biosynthesis protein n=1 Tax=Saccharopolyspora indica TaxID=1229659 RepID=UPI0022EB51E4|nr:phenazine antibiotic biosynthesis protein [Saccharopolyspora indica]MDA3648916.1 phenazine antibiotic biosynthesis protein [Saccharopolyspora indica]
MSEQAASALDVPWDSPPDSRDLIQEAVEWHFNPKTGSPFWQEQAKKLDFDPRTDVSSVEDLALFPNVVDELRHIRVEDLVPRGYESIGELPAPPVVGESGGTTGAPKRVFVLPDVREQSWAWYHNRLQEHGIRNGDNWLGCMPAGPHMAGIVAQDTAHRFGSVFFTLDLDPRWVKLLVGRGAAEEAKHYVTHIVNQLEWILQSQDVGVMVITPPLIEALCRRDNLVDLVNEKVNTIIYGGTSMDPDTRQLLRTEVFPQVDLVSIFGSTMIFCVMPERPGAADTDPPVFDPPSPFSMFSVIDPGTGKNVPYGERGQVVTHHITRNLFLPNNLDRDTGVRHPHRLGYPGDAVAEFRPVQEFGDTAVIEGVY